MNFCYIPRRGFLPSYGSSGEAYLLWILAEGFEGVLSLRPLTAWPSSLGLLRLSTSCLPLLPLVRGPDIYNRCLCTPTQIWCSAVYSSASSPAPGGSWLRHLQLPSRSAERQRIYNPCHVLRASHDEREDLRLVLPNDILENALTKAYWGDKGSLFRTGETILFTIKIALNYGGWVSVMEVRISLVPDEEKFRFCLQYAWRMWWVREREEVKRAICEEALSDSLLSTFLNKETFCNKRHDVQFISTTQISPGVAYDRNKRPLPTSQMSLALFGPIEDCSRAHAAYELVTSWSATNCQALVNQYSHSAGLGLHMFW